MKILATILMFTICLTTGFSQIAKMDSLFYANYEQRIKQSRIDGVYIPKDLDDAFSELDELSEPAGIEKFKNAPEEVVAQKLKGGLGRWMLINWGFTEGSRLSHYISELGIKHQEDMSQFLIVSYHRYLNNRPLDIEGQVVIYQKKREEEYQQRVKKDTIKKE